MVNTLLTKLLNKDKTCYYFCTKNVRLTYFEGKVDRKAAIFVELLVLSYIFCHNIVSKQTPLG